MAVKRKRQPAGATATDTTTWTGPESMRLLREIAKNTVGLGDRVGILELGLRKLDGRVEKLDGRVEKLDGRLERVEGRLEHVEVGLEKLTMDVEKLAEQSARDRLEMRMGFSAVSDEFALLRHEMRQDSRTLREEMREAFSAMDRRFDVLQAAINDRPTMRDITLLNQDINARIDSETAKIHARLTVVEEEIARLKG